MLITSLTETLKRALHTGMQNRDWRAVTFPSTKFDQIPEGSTGYLIPGSRPAIRRHGRFFLDGIHPSPALDATHFTAHSGAANDDALVAVLLTPLEEALRPTPQGDDVASAEAARFAAEGMLEVLRAHVIPLRIEQARRELGTAFPDHTLAVFGRYWEDREANLRQLISDRRDTDDVEVTSIDGTKSLTPAQRQAISSANVALYRLSDDDLAEYLTEGETPHSDWIEFTLGLAPVPPAAEPAIRTESPRHVEI